MLGQIGTLEFPSRESFEALLGLREQQEPVRDELYRSVDDLSVEMLAELPPAAMAEGRRLRKAAWILPAFFSSTWA